LAPLPILATALGPLSYPSRSALGPPFPIITSFGKLPLGKLHILEVATKEIVIWEVVLGKIPLGNCHLGSRPWENTIRKLSFGKSPLEKYH